MSAKLSLMPVSLDDLGPGLHAMLKIAIGHSTPLEREVSERAMRDIVCESFDRLAKVCPRGASLWQPHPRRFAITVPGMSERGARDLADQAQAILTQTPVATIAGAIQTTCIIGAVAAHNTNLETLTASARGALIEAMNSGAPLRTAKSDRDARFQRARVLSMAQSALTALNGAHVSVQYQPVVSASGTQATAFHQCQAKGVLDEMAGQEMTGQEALFTSPSIDQLLDRCALVHALDALGEDPLARLAVPVQQTAFADREWMQLLHNEIQHTADVAERLIVEVPEKALQQQALSGFLNTLRERGACISLTELGARQIPMNELAAFNFDMARLCPGLTENISQRPDAQLLIDSLVAQANRLDMMVIGAETHEAEDAHVLAKLGVDYLQGDLFGEESAVLSPRNAPDQALRHIA